MPPYHIPVMLKEVLDSLNIKKGAWYIDCNLGGGGHTQGILKRGGKVLGLDLDPDAITEVAKKYNLNLASQAFSLQGYNENLIIYQTNFSKIKEVADKFKISPVAGVLFDLGVSTYQLETPERGFSFNLPAPLDMRMDKASSITAADLINGLYEKELAGLFWKFGEERFCRQIARKIVSEREKGKITTTNQLAQIITSVRPRSRVDRTHPATRVFQALRIAVNDELNSLKEALPAALATLAPGGRLAIISFHSLEDRLVKNFFRDNQKVSKLKILTPKPTTPSFEEVAKNPRSRSGKLRVAVKL